MGFFRKIRLALRKFPSLYSLTAKPQRPVAAKESEMTPAPKHFTDLSAFLDAYVTHALRNAPKVERYDSYADASEKQAVIEDLREAATERAWLEWDAHVDRMQELYERGIGPAWA
jgi:tRNA U34 5-methylaminomethyl-2-thiouridine-forming methyltransferase MnmC